MRARATATAGRARPGRGRQTGGRRESGRAGVARFCHLIHIIMGISVLDGGGELITPVTVSPCPRLMNSSAAFLPPRRIYKSEVLRQSRSSASLPRDHISAALWISPFRTSARTE